MNPSKHSASPAKTPSKSTHPPKKLKVTQDHAHDREPAGPAPADGAEGMEIGSGSGPRAPQVKLRDSDESNMAATGGSGARRSLLLEQMASSSSDKPPTWFVNFFDQFEQRLDRMIEKRLHDLTAKVGENEEKLNAVTIHLDEMEKEVKRLKAERKELIVKVDDLENRSRRNNLILHGVPESPRESCVNTVKEILCDFVGIEPDSVHIERCHRTPTSPSTTSRGEQRNLTPKPRIIHIAFGTYGEKERARKACISKFKEGRFKGQKLFVSEDFSRRVLDLRREKLDRLKRLKEDGKKPFFLYPARLAFRDATGKLHFVDGP